MKAHAAFIGLPGVIRTASATKYGEMSGANLFSEPDFLLPGVEIRAPGGKEVGGSSFSTAYVAGLATVMLCFLRAHLELRGEKLERQRRLEFTKSMDGMKTIFKLLGGKDASDRTEGPPGPSQI